MTFIRRACIILMIFEVIFEQISNSFRNCSAHLSHTSFHLICNANLINVTILFQHITDQLVSRCSDCSVDADCLPEGRGYRCLCRAGFQGSGLQCEGMRYTIELTVMQYRKGTSIRQAPVFRHLRVLRKSPWKFIIWMNEL